MRRFSAEEWVAISTRHWRRQMAIDILRDECRLSLFEVMGSPAEEVRERQAIYEARLGELKKKWALEDEALAKQLGLDKGELDELGRI